MAKNPWGTPDKKSSNWAAPSKDRKAPAAKKDSSWGGKDNTKSSFTKSQSAKDSLGKKLFGGR